MNSKIAKKPKAYIFSDLYSEHEHNCKKNTITAVKVLNKMPLNYFISALLLF
jgi:hypothetical protein